jgi:hypothetical protein
LFSDQDPDSNGSMDKDKGSREIKMKIPKKEKRRNVLVEDFFVPWSGSKS